MMDKARIGLISRLLLGLIFTVFGLNGFLNFLPMPEMNAGAMAFLGGLMSAPYFFPLLKATELICGVLLLANMYVPLALLVLAPVVLNIFLFHVTVAGLEPISILVTVLLVLAAYAYLGSYSSVLRKKTDI